MSKARILVVDDEPAVLKVLVTRLQLAGYQVYSATNGEEALESFHRDSPDLIVLDVMLPKMDGFAVCRRIRAESVVPIIFLTAFDRKVLIFSYSAYEIFLLVAFVYFNCYALQLSAQGSRASLTVRITFS